MRIRKRVRGVYHTNRRTPFGFRSLASVSCKGFVSRAVCKIRVLQNSYR
jgi:hypothetical protein